jgi:hypothetical protein
VPRRLWNILAIVSMLVCIALLVVWVRSYFYQDGFGYTSITGGRYRAWGFSSWTGSIMYMHSDYPIGDKQVDLGLRWSSSRRRAISFLTSWSHWGFWAFSANMYPNDPNGGVPFTQAGVPYWALCILTAVAPSLWWLSHRRRRKWRHRGLCRVCGYDLRATPHRCPECGTAVAPSASP